MYQEEHILVGVVMHRTLVNRLLNDAHEWCRHQQFEKEKDKRPRELLDTVCQLTHATTPSLPTAGGTISSSSCSSSSSAKSIPHATAYAKTSLVQREQPCLHIQLFVPQGGGIGRDMVTAWDHVEAGVAMSRYAVDCPRHVAAPILEHVLRGDPKFEEMKKSLTTNVGGVTLNNILTKIEAPHDLPEAPQPAGLTSDITLRDYQRCALLAQPVSNRAKTQRLLRGHCSACLAAVYSSNVVRGWQAH